jgi:L-lactate dehydrogenase (cytochrome)
MTKALQWRNVEDARRAARRRAHRMVFDYIDGGADDEITLRRNSSDFDKFDLPHRTLTGISNPDTSVTLLGRKHPQPFLLSPAAGNRLFHTQGERAVARAAAKRGLTYSLSTLSSVSIEDIAALTDGPKWFQVYVWKDKALLRDMLARVRAAGFEAIVLTADFPITGNRERDLANGFAIPPRMGARQIFDALRAPAWSLDYLFGPQIRYANLNQRTAATSLNAFVADQLDPSFGWAQAEALLAEWNGPALLKGVVHPDDAVRAAALGFRGLFVSNHGGRQLDGGMTPITAVKAIADRVGGQLDIILDGGVRRGTHVLKALGAGASAVSFARPWLYGLAAAGEAGVDAVLDLMIAGIRRDMILAGIASCTALTER